MQEIQDGLGDGSTAAPVAVAAGRAAPRVAPNADPKPRRGGLPGLRTLAVLVLALAALAPTVGDFGLTWDEPAYRYSQIMSAQWWQGLAQARSWGAAQEWLDPDTLLYYWPYGRFGINFHPPLAGQLNLAAHALLGGWMKDIPARRMATVVEFALTITILFQFLARRYGAWAGLTAAGALLLMPRLYGQAHLIDTDIPGLMLWAATAVAFWKGLTEPRARRYRVAVGVLLGLAFVEKMGAVVVLLPLLFWLLVARLPRSLAWNEARGAWIDGVLTSGFMLAPLGLAFEQIQILQQRLPPPDVADLFVNKPPADLPGLVLAVPLLVWLARRLLGRLWPRHAVWGVERPGLETWTAILAFAPLVGWLGNPAWWRETLPRLAHYYTLSSDRYHALPTIQVLYLGQTYEYSLPWHSVWVLLGVTVPIATLIAAAIGLGWGLGRSGRDRLPLYFLLHFLTLPLIRVFPTPAHDGVRLLLPMFFFLAAFAGWGAIAVADLVARLARGPAAWARPAAAALVLAPATIALASIHPYELSYYNAIVGGPRGAWARGFELTYWYDAFNGPVLADLNAKLPQSAEVDFLNDKTNPITFQELQTLGALRGDIELGRHTREKFPYAWLLAQDSKASAFTRLLFAMTPWYASRPRQLDGARVVTVADPVAVSRAWALSCLLDTGDLSPPPPPAAPDWVRVYAPWLERLWGDGVETVHRLAVNKQTLAWSRDDPQGLLRAAQAIVSSRTARSAPTPLDASAQRLLDLLTVEASPNPRSPQVRHELTDQILAARPQALVEAVEMLNRHRDQLVHIMTRYSYTDVEREEGFLDRDLSPPK